jgi:hypothetical protein
MIQADPICVVYYKKRKATQSTEEGLAEGDHLVAVVEGVGAHCALGACQRALHVRLGPGQKVVKVELAGLNLQRANGKGL